MKVLMELTEEEGGFIRQKKNVCQGLLASAVELRKNIPRETRH